MGDVNTSIASQEQHWSYAAKKGGRGRKIDLLYSPTSTSQVLANYAAFSWSGDRFFSWLNAHLRVRTLRFTPHPLSYDADESRNRYLQIACDCHVCYSLFSSAKWVKLSFSRTVSNLNSDKWLNWTSERCRVESEGQWQQTLFIYLFSTYIFSLFPFSLCS